MTASKKVDWDDAFDNMGHIPDAPTYPAMWAARAAAYRNNADFAEFDIAYGDHERAVLDIFWPDATPKGLAVFVHGGYWMRLDKSYWSDLAEGARQNGWAVAIPSYVLAPEARISEITDQIALAVAKAAEIVDGPVHLAGHSAGGHLVTRLMTNDRPSPVPHGCIKLGGSTNVGARIKQVLSISGLHDLRPLLHTTMNATLRLTPDEAKSESTVLQMPVDGIPVTCWVGENERPEFLKQAKLLCETWRSHDCETTLCIDQGKHHFTVLDGLRHANSPITHAFTAQAFSTQAFAG